MRFSTLALVACASLVHAVPVSAGIVTHTSQAAFLAAAGGVPTLVDFETLPIGTFVPNGVAQPQLGGLTFQYGPGFGAAQLRVTNGTLTTPNALSTISGTRFLGSDVTSDQLAPGGSNNFTIVVPGGARALGLFVIVSDDGFGGGAPVLPQDFRLTAGGTTAFSSVPITPNLPDGSQAFFLGLTEDTGVSLGNVTLSTANDASGYRYRVDNISFVTAVPEPGSLASLLGIAVLWPTLRRGRKRS